MAGIYIHIPFCKQACHYCNFHFSTSRQLLPQMMHSIKQEAALRNTYLQGETVSTIYFGGGTPSLVPVQLLKELLDKLYALFTVTDEAEITLETNPDDITAENLDAWKAIGINRLSIGVQSFVEADLVWMNRAHTSIQALQCIQLAQSKGFDNITIDLIYGTPTLSDEQWQQNVQQVIDLNIPHVSCYALTVEPKTALDHMIRTHKLEDVDTDKQAHHFELLMQWLATAGYEHYEVSNFARPGFRSKHNSSYWQGKHYIGLGPSAHSFNGTSRQWNIANNALYIKSILEENKVPFEIEELTPTQQLNEYIMTSLRTLEGLSLHKIDTTWPMFTMMLEERAKKWTDSNDMIKAEDHLRLTNKGRLLADGIAADLFQ